MALPSTTHAQSSRPFPFHGQTVVFTGKLASLGRRDARALVQRLGGVAADGVTTRTTVLVIGAEGFAAGRADRASESPDVGGDGFGEKSNKLRNAEEANAQTPGRVRILSEEEFCQLGGLRSHESLRSRYHSLRRIREVYPLVRETHLAYLEKWGLIRSLVRTNADTYYTFSDVAVVKQVHEALRQQGSFRSAVRALLAVREGQLVLNFGAVRGDAQPAKVLALREASPRSGASVVRRSAPANETQAAMAARFFLEGSEFDEGPEADQERARAAYRKALLLDPNLVPAVVNLANIHYARDELVEAQALYGRALSLDADCFEAYFNLGNIHHDLGRYDEAVAYYDDALRLNAAYADAHFYLAVTLEKMGSSTEAKIHWRAYRHLAPDGEWVELAKEFSE